MGTPEFAVPSLEILADNGYEVVAVVTATDKLGGRGGKQVLESAVKKAALARNIQVLQPKNLKAPEFVQALEGLKPDLQVVVAFRMLPEVVWAMPRIGTFNLHGSLLPKYRGAAPINWAVIAGEKETGVTTFFLQQEIDTGDVILQRKLSIDENETAGEVHDRLMELGAKAVLETVQLIESGAYSLQPQNTSLVTKAPKLFHETCEINFAQATAQVHNFIRGLSPYPAAWTTVQGKELKILRTLKVDSPPQHTPGTLVADHKKSIRFPTLDGYIEVLELQLEGRKRMDVVAFLNGRHLEL
ncbi:MAG: methionyl-tRNA formyltransferase [Saprospirales bacterium]|nr:methionyl-tRNA formyltransferase [Saprospirales bacterium]